MAHPSPQVCIRCKGKLLCGMPYCPILERYSSHRQAFSSITNNELSGSSPPAVFVSWKNYPKVGFSPLAPAGEHNTALFDSPEKWFGKAQQEIIGFRERLVGARTNLDAGSAANPGRLLGEMQEMAMSDRPTDVEIKLDRAPSPKLSFSAFSAPTGPSANLEKFTLAENPHIPQKVDYLVSDTDVKSSIALSELFDSDIPVSYLHKILSAGLLGVKKNRKLVPTRWSITAVDSNLSEHLLDKIRYSPTIDEIRIFHSAYLDNHFYTVLFPSAWQFEQLEAWLPGASWNVNSPSANVIQDHEPFRGRKKYASNVEGAYYAARLAVAEYLRDENAQAACLVFREIGNDYNIPLGVWVIRETMRDAMKKKPLTFQGRKLAFSYLSRKLKVPMKLYEKKSKLLDSLKHQTQLAQWA